MEKYSTQAFALFDHLNLQYLQLNHDFFTRDEFEDQERHTLVKQFENAGRLYRAEKLRQQHAHTPQVQVDQLAGKDYPPPAHRRQ